MRDLTAHGVTFLWILRFSFKKRSENKTKGILPLLSQTQALSTRYISNWGRGALVRQCGLQSHSNSPLPRWLWNRNSSPNNYCREYSGLGKSGLWRKWKSPWIRWTDAEESKRTKLKRVKLKNMFDPSVERSTKIPVFICGRQIYK